MRGGRTMTLWTVGLALWAIWPTATSWAQRGGDERLIRVRDAAGKPTSLYEKVVVINDFSTLSEHPTASGEPIDAWAIFFRIKNDDGGTDAISGRLRVGDSTGKPIGWIPEKDLLTWNTRFILEPIEPQRDRAFEVRTEGGGTARQNATPEGKRRYALITSAPEVERGDDTEYPVVVYAGNVQSDGQRGTLARQRNDLSDTSLEIMFVIESSDFMFNEYKQAEGRTLLDFVKASIRGLIADIRKDPEIAKAVRLGFCEYKDSVPKAAFASRITCDLTDDFDEFSRSLDRMEASKLQDDWPDDVIAGLASAVGSQRWKPNSVKHVILLGMASCQLTAQGQNPFQSGRNGAIDRWCLKNIPHGYSSSGMNIAQLVARSRPQGGGDSRARSTKMLHALHFGRDEIEETATQIGKPVEEFRSDVNEFEELISSLDDDTLNDLEPDVFRTVFAFWKLGVSRQQRSLALAQYQELARNNGEADGVFLAVAPGPEAVQKAVGTLSGKIRETFEILEKVREGEGLQGQTSNEIAQPLYTLVGAAAEKFKKSPVIPGMATVRDQRGREVAFKKVMVSESELRRLGSTLDSLFTKFKSKTAKADRQDVGSILDEMKVILAETSLGQEVAANAKLKDLISDLPLRSAALETTPADLALMTAEAFKEWLEKVESAKFRIKDLLDSRQDWMELSEKAVNERFTFLRLSELP